MIFFFFQTHPVLGIIPTTCRRGSTSVKGTPIYCYSYNDTIILLKYLHNQLVYEFCGPVVLILDGKFYNRLSMCDPLNFNLIF